MRNTIIINSQREKSIIALCAQVLQHLKYFIEVQRAWLQLSFNFILLLSKSIQGNSSSDKSLDTRLERTFNNNIFDGKSPFEVLYEEEIKYLLRSVD